MAGKQTIYQQLGTSPKGLKQSRIRDLQAEYGPNTIVQQKHFATLKLLLSQFSDVMVLILLAATLIAYWSGEKVDALVILIVVFLNAAIGFIQEYRADHAVAALQKLLAPHARVIRNGREQVLAAHELVPGDLLILEAGDAIPADSYVISAEELAVQEAVLTGESLPVSKEELSSLAQQKDLHKVFMGTTLTHGQARAIVYATGMKTEFGKITKLTRQTASDESPLQQELKSLGSWIAKVIILISGLLLLIGFYFQGKPLLETMLFSVSVAVALVPEGLPTTITIALALGVQKLAKQNAIVKKLTAVETLGSTTVICSDKTGTLTKNEMTVKQIWLNDYLLEVAGSGYETHGTLEIVNPIINKANGAKIINGHLIGRGPQADQAQNLMPALELLSQAVTLNNHARLIRRRDKIEVLGDPTEAALLVLAAKAGLHTNKTIKDFPILKEIPFDSDRKLMSTLHRIDNQLLVFTKGSPDHLLSHAKFLYLNGQQVPLTSELKHKLKAQYSQMGEQALRVLAIAYKKVAEVPQSKKELNELETDLTLLGLVGMIDPPREEVRAACEAALSAGIKIYIVTGDAGETALAIAQQIGLNNLKMLTGTELEKFDDTELRNFIKKEGQSALVFARVKAEHKRWIVDTLKKMGEIVAVTGDGVNDAPALKRADIGIAMGIGGTDVSREAASMVLSDNSFASIVTAVEEGRRIYENIKKFIFYIFSCNIAELLTVLAGVALGLPAPLTAILILCINLGTDVLPAVALGIEPAEQDLMQKNPRRHKSHILDKNFLERTLSLGILMGLTVVGTYLGNLYFGGWRWGTALSADDVLHTKASTIAFALLVLIQIVNAYNARSSTQSVFKLKFFANYQLFMAGLSSVLMVLLIVHTPFLNQVLGTVPLSLKEWGTVVGLSLSILVFEEIRKLLVRQRHKE